MSKIIQPSKEEMFKDYYSFDEITTFEHLWHLEERKNRCPYCNKKILIYYNDDHEMFIEICENVKCRNYRAYIVMERFDRRINLDQVILPDYGE